MLNFLLATAAAARPSVDTHGATTVSYWLAKSAHWGTIATVTAADQRYREAGVPFGKTFQYALDEEKDNMPVTFMTGVTANALDVVAGLAKASLAISEQTVSIEDGGSCVAEGKNVMSPECFHTTLSGDLRLLSEEEFPEERDSAIRAMIKADEFWCQFYHSYCSEEQQARISPARGHNSHAMKFQPYKLDVTRVYLMAGIARGAQIVDVEVFKQLSPTAYETAASADDEANAPVAEPSTMVLPAPPTLLRQQSRAAESSTVLPPAAPSLLRQKSRFE